MLTSLLVATMLGVQVVGRSACPSPQAVQARLEALAPGWTSEGVASVDPEPAGIRVSLYAPGGRLVAQRAIEASDTCAALADVSAVILASWLSELQPRSVGLTPLTKVNRPAPAPVERPDRSWSYELGVGPTASFAASTFAPGVLVEAAAGPREAAWALHLSGLYDGPRAQAEGPGTVIWQRVEAGAGAAWAVTHRPLRWELEGEVTVADLFLRGTGFRSDASTSSLDPGVRLGTRVVALPGPWHLWAGLFVSAGLAKEVPQVPGLSLQATLPWASGMAVVGGSWESAERF